MEQTLQIISLQSLAYSFIPVAVVFVILAKWSLSTQRAMTAISRMLVQLLLIGYFLVYIFESDNAWFVGFILVLMVFFSSWIALSNLPIRKAKVVKSALISIFLSAAFTIIIITQGVLALSPWYYPQTLLPIAGMIFASCMNAVSLSGERFYAELSKRVSYQQARNIAFQTSMIPNINALVAVGIVSLPGMMTGQILSGVSPFVAARYQIMVMCMVFASAGIASAIFLILVKDKPFQLKNKSNGS
jgi:putative ABC transport system permease protein|tara:strand:- start:3650 stop:4384 length:735 start_codon:yes stop_codon:yes gene_type:complete